MSHFDINKQSENLILVLQNLVYNNRYIPTTGIYRYTGRSTCRGPRNSFLWLSVGAKMTKSQIAIHCSSLCSILSKMNFFYHFKHFNRNDAAVTGAVSRSFHLLSKMQKIFHWSCKIKIRSSLNCLRLDMHSSIISMHLKIACKVCKS